jgi:hypothetical protein
MSEKSKMSNLTVEFAVKARRSQFANCKLVRECCWANPLFDQITWHTILLQKRYSSMTECVGRALTKSVGRLSTCPCQICSKCSGRLE